VATGNFRHLGLDASGHGALGEWRNEGLCKERRLGGNELGRRKKRRTGRGDCCQKDIGDSLPITNIFNYFMIPIHPHMVSTTLVALPAAAAFTRKLIQDCKASASMSLSPERLNHIEQRAKAVTNKLKTVVGYQHFGIND
jgi:hypothetical protein